MICDDENTILIFLILFQTKTTIDDALNTKIAAVVKMRHER